MKRVPEIEERNRVVGFRDEHLLEALDRFIVTAKTTQPAGLSLAELPSEAANRAVRTTHRPVVRVCGRFLAPLPEALLYLS